MTLLRDIFGKILTPKTPQQLGRELLAELSKPDYNVQKAHGLITSGAATDIKDERGWTALIWAVWWNQGQIVSALLDSGAALDEKDGGGRTALHWAVSKGNTKIVRTLLDKEAQVDEKDNEGFTPLPSAAFRGYTEIAAMLQAEPERRRLAQEAWVKAGMPMDGVKAARPLKLKKKESRGAGPRS